ncbi:MAG: DUF2079 domain-containing protein, partial [Eubacteriales bacterium]|nr:DUF2079 domain-containing protein [Eubacteriales bacterium]
ASQCFLTALALRSPFISLSLGLLLMEAALFVLLRRRRASRRDPRTAAEWKRISLQISLVLLALAGGKLLYNLAFARKDLREDERFRYYSRDHVRMNINLNEFILTIIILIFLLAAIFLIREFVKNSLSDRAKLSMEKNRGKIIFGGLMVSVLLLWLFLSEILIGRVLQLQTPTFDMGIFTQMYHGMLRTGSPLTTVERDQLMSHFGVHFSPILYLLLPVFYLFSSQMTLQVLQLLIVFSSFIPLFRILGKLKLPKSWSLLALLLLMASPQLLGSNLYDFHENCFLAPLLLWLVDALLGKKKLQLVIFTLLTLMVKEDAAVYVVSIGLWALFALPRRREEPESGREFSRKFLLLLLIILPIVYFVFAVQMIRLSGGEPMLSRFANLNAFPDLGLGGIFLSFLLHPAPVIVQTLAPVKMFYLVVVLACLGFLPLLQKKAAHYFLFLPLLTINLLSNWVHQHQFRFQYGYGTVALLIFALLVFLYDLQAEKRPVAMPWAGPGGGDRIKIVLSVALLFSIIFSGVYLLIPHMQPREAALAEVREAKEIQLVLEEIPRDRKILASSRFVPELADITDLYVVEYHNEQEADQEIDYVVFDQTKRDSTGLNLMKKYELKGYRVSELSGSKVLVLQAP